MRITPPQSVSGNTPRSSNLELYRIVCMLMIVAHHYVVNSGLMSKGGLIIENPESLNSLWLIVFGAWGKVGINCFLMITGYFMCKSSITFKKFLKLLLQIYFYKLLLYPIFLVAGYESLSPFRLVKLIMPFWGIDDSFEGCFLVFYLTIPFWNILINNMSSRLHLLLILLLIVSYTLLGSVPSFDVSFNYVTWFGIIYLLAAYIRLYPLSVFENRKLWGWSSLGCVVLAIASILLLNHLFTSKQESTSIIYHFVADSNKIFAVAIAVSTFLWFKNINIKYSKVINTFGAATFGVLLIHANSNAMRTWLWQDTIDVVGHYTLPLGQLVLFSIVVVLAIFIICNLIDQLRIATLERYFFAWYDKKLSVKADEYINRITIIR